jgi:SAM-dependent methyltransferase
MGAHYQDQAALTAATDACLGAGMRVLQLFQAGDEAEHVSMLLRLLDAPADALIVDVGCGVGEVARLMQEERSDLSFLLLNLSEYQLTLCPEHMERVRADMHAMPIMPESVDVVMVNYTLGYADLPLLMKEARRVLRRGGILFIYDLASRDMGAVRIMRERFGYTLHCAMTVADAADRAGLALNMVCPLAAGHAHLAPLLDDDYRAALAHVAAHAKPTAWRFIKG